MDDFIIAETDTFFSKIESRLFHSIYQKINEYIYPQLRKNPFFGLHIKKLKGKFKDIYRYRSGKYRIFYQIDPKKNLVIMIDISRRKDSYKK